MELHSQNNDSFETIQILEGQLRECFGRVVYTHKTHEKCADILLRHLTTIKLWQIILSAVATGGFLLRFLGLGIVGSIIGFTVSAILLCLTLYTKDYNLAELAQKHKSTATDIWLIREKYQSLITDLVVGGKPLETVRRERDVLMEDLHTVYSGAPSTTYKAYKEAQHSLKYNEEMTFSDEEIDAFLPTELRRSERNNSSNE